MPKGHFEIWQKACGLTYAKCCLLLDKQLRRSNILHPAKQYCHDWMHCLVSAGIIQVAIYMICSNLPTGTGWSMVHDYLELWICPQHLPQHLKTLFDSKHVKKYQQNKKLVARPVKPWQLCQFWFIWWKHCCFPKDFLIQNCVKLSWPVQTFWIWCTWAKCGAFALLRPYWMQQNNVWQSGLTQGWKA